MAAEDKVIGLVRAYDSTGHRMKVYPVTAGTEADWKRNGVPGCYRVRILACKPGPDGGPGKAQIQLLYHGWRSGTPLTDTRPRWVKASFLAVYDENGVRR